MLKAIHWCLLAIVFGLLILKAFLEFRVEWDYLAYHLPGMLKPFGLTTYTPERHLVEILAGFPPLPHRIAGFLAWSTGQVRTANAHNSVALAFSLFGIWHLMGSTISWRVLLTGLLAIPMVVIHMGSGYIDLSTGSFLALGFASLLRFSDEAPAPKPRTLVWLLIGLGGAMLCKYQAWPAVAVLSVFVSYLWFKSFKLSRPRSRNLILFACFFPLVIGFWPIRNIVKFNNPTYPIKTPLLGTLFPNHLPWTDQDDPPQILHGMPKPVLFLCSALECTRFLSDKPFRWTMDQGHTGKNEYPHHRMGGWFFATVLINLFVLVYGVRQKHVRPLPVVALLAAIFTISSLLASYEMRYWLFVPICLTILSARIAAFAPSVVRNLFIVLFLGSASYVLAKIDPFALDLRPPEDHGPAEAKAYWKEMANVSQPPQLSLCGKMPFAIFWAGPNFNELPVLGCDGAGCTCDPKHSTVHAF